jgi:hypothetical protein
VGTETAVAQQEQRPLSRGRLWWPLVVALGLTHALLYALLLPPWGVVDEEQHFDYVQRLASGDGPPHLGQTYLAQPLADAVYASDRWAKFGWSSPPSADPTTWGLEGLSYEGHQPRLYYELLAGLLGVLELPVVDELYVARCLTAALSLVTLFCLRRTLLTLWPRRQRLVLIACLVLAVTPGYAAAVARVNNDSLAGAIGATFSLLAMQSVLGGLTRRRAIGLGLLLCAALATKVTAAFLGVLLVPLAWHRRGSPGASSNLGIIAGLLLVGVSFALLHALGSSPGELGMDWNALRNYDTPLFDLRELVKALVSLLTSFWIASDFYNSWRYGTWVDAAWGNLAFWPLLGLLTLAAMAAVGPAWRRVRAHSTEGRLAPDLRMVWLESAVLTVLAAVSGTVALTFLGLTPTPQGRFLLPYVILGMSIIVATFRTVRFGMSGLIALAGLLAVIDVVWLWDRELVRVYAESAYAMNRVGGSPVGTWALLCEVFADKPGWTMPAAGLAFLGYVGSWGALALQAWAHAWSRRQPLVRRRSPA